jgi:paraquat-inducible protein A
MTHATAGHELVACHDCDLLHHVAPLAPGSSARCTRCGCVIARNRAETVNRTLAWTLASLVLFIVANTFPILVFKMGGRVQENDLVSGCIELYRQGYLPLAALVFLSSVLAPAVRIAGLLYVLVPLKLGRPPLQLVPVFRVVQVLEPWSMLEVFMLGVIVAVIKLSDLAEVALGTGLFAFMGLIIASTAAVFVLDPELIWRSGPRTRRAAAGAPVRAGASPVPEPVS